VVLTVTVTTKLEDRTVFLVEIGQAGIFRIVNVPDEQVEPLVAVACPNILFPYAREAVSDAVTRAGFAPIVLQPVNFEAMYMQRLQEQASSGPTEVPIQ
jgi:preprotein translocase subunit SecB